jgi:hypothetical protein
MRHFLHLLLLATPCSLGCAREGVSALELGTPVESVAADDAEPVAGGPAPIDALVPARTETATFALG